MKLIHQSSAAKQRRELSPGRRFGSPGKPRQRIWSRGAATEPVCGARHLNRRSAAPKLIVHVAQGSQSLAFGRRAERCSAARRFGSLRSSPDFFGAKPLITARGSAEILRQTKNVRRK